MSKALDVPKNLEDSIDLAAAQARSITHGSLGTISINQSITRSIIVVLFRRISSNAVLPLANIHNSIYKFALCTEEGLSLSNLRPKHPGRWI